MLRVYGSGLAKLYTKSAIIQQRSFIVAPVCHLKQDVVTTSSEDDFKKSAVDQFTNKTIKTHFKRAAKKPARPPLVKNFFSGKVDTDLLTFPEVIPRDDMINLYRDVENAVQYFKENIDSQKIVADRQIPAQVIGDIKELKMFGLNVPTEFGGSGYGATEMALSSECEANDISVAVTLNAHRLATRIIAECGTEAQQRMYLPRLANGDLIGTIAFYESKNPEENIFSTRATQTHLKSWLINGEKSFVTNGENANLYIVFAQSLVADKLGDMKDTVSVFLVEKSMAGVSVIGRDETIGCDGVPQAGILLDNVEVNAENVIGAVGNGTDVAQKLLRHARLQSGIVSLLLMKSIIRQLTQFCIDTTQFGVKLMDMELLRDKLSKATCVTYALESMIYLTAGITDDYEDADIDIETAIIRIFAQRNLLSIASIALDFMGPKTLLYGQPHNLTLRNTLQLYTHGEPIDSLNLLVGLSGIQNAGVNLQEVVRKVRNPLLNPSFIFKRLFEMQSVENPKSSMNLNHHLHPSLDPAAQWLEHSIVRLQTGTETLLSRYGVEILDKQVEIMRLSECAVLTFAMFASVARASRAYCIGLQHSDYEMLMSSAFSYDSMRAIKQRALDMREGPYLTNDRSHQKISKQLFSSKGYFAVHPLTRNF